MSWLDGWCVLNTCTDSLHDTHHSAAFGIRRVPGERDMCPTPFFWRGGVFWYLVFLVLNYITFEVKMRKISDKFRKQWVSGEGGEISEGRVKYFVCKIRSPGKSHATTLLGILTLQIHRWACDQWRWGLKFRSRDPSPLNGEGVKTEVDRPIFFVLAIQK